MPRIITDSSVSVYGGKAPYRLVERIVALSVADTWHEARQEWTLADIFYDEEGGTCLCGHTHIVEHCVLVNRLNGNKAVVGNVCVQRFLGLPSGALFAALGKIRQSLGAAPSKQLIEYAFEKGWIDDWKYNFCLHTQGMKRLSEKQRAKRREINERILWHATEGRSHG